MVMGQNPGTQMAIGFTYLYSFFFPAIKLHL